MSNKDCFFVFKASSSLRIMAILNQMGISFGGDWNDSSSDSTDNNEIENEIDISVFKTE